MSLFKDFHEVGTTVIVASHDRALVESMGKRIVDLDHGRIRYDQPERLEFASEVAVETQPESYGGR